MRRYLLRVSLVSLLPLVGVGVGLAAAPAEAAGIGCSVSGGVLTITLPPNGFSLALTYQPASNGLFVDADGVTTTCAAGAFTTLTKVTFAADNSTSYVTLHQDNPWTRTAGGYVRVDFAPLTAFGALTLDATGATDERTVDLGTDINGLSLDGANASEIYGFTGLGQLHVYTGSGKDAIDLSGGTSIQYADVETGDGSDTVGATPQGGVYVLGDGDDKLTGTADGAWVYPGPGADNVDVVDTHAKFFVTPDGAADTLAATDLAVLDLTTATTAVSVSDDGTPNDGALGEGDDYTGLGQVSTGSGNDTVDLSDGAITNVDVGAGDDTVLGGDTTAVVLGGTGDNTLDLAHWTNPGDPTYGAVGTLEDAGSEVTHHDAPGGSIAFEGFRTLRGTPMDDDLTASCDGCTVEPGAGDDVVEVGAGAAFKAGTNDGVDVVSGAGLADYSGRSTPVSISLDGNDSDGAPGEGDNINTRQVLGGSGADVLVGDGQADVLTGGPGNDTLVGRGGADVLHGGSGNDTLQGSTGDDVLRGEVGSDRLLGNDGNDTLYGDDQAGPAGNDTLDGGLGDDDEYGYAGADAFLEGASDNGSDLLDGGDGAADVANYSGRTGALRLSLNYAWDDGAAGEGDDIRGSVENVIGGKGADVITGNEGANTITGGGGNDTLTGGLGKDQLYGEAGNDRFYAKDNAKDSLSGGSGTDKARHDAIDALLSVEGTF